MEDSTRCRCQEPEDIQGKAGEIRWNPQAPEPKKRRVPIWHSNHMKSVVNRILTKLTVKPKPSSATERADQIHCSTDWQEEATAWVWAAYACQQTGFQQSTEHDRTHQKAGKCHPPSRQETANRTKPRNHSDTGISDKNFKTTMINMLQNQGGKRRHQTHGNARSENVVSGQSSLYGYLCRLWIAQERVSDLEDMNRNYPS